MNNLIEHPEILRTVAVLCAIGFGLAIAAAGLAKFTAWWEDRHERHRTKYLRCARRYEDGLEDGEADQ